MKIFHDPSGISSLEKNRCLIELSFLWWIVKFNTIDTNQWTATMLALTCERSIGSWIVVP
jgi:hypothetical protein